MVPPSGSDCYFRLARSDQATLEYVDLTGIRYQYRQAAEGDEARTGQSTS